MNLHRRRLITRSSSSPKALAAIFSVIMLISVSLIGNRSAQAEPEKSATNQAASGTYTVFNQPGAGGVVDTRIQDDLVKLIEQTPADETIHGSMFSWTQTPVAQALSDAQARGVHVKLAIDTDGGEVNSDPNNKAQKILKAADLDQLVYCTGPNESTSCIGTTGGINHNKLFTFSKTGDKTDAVWVASYNLTTSQGYWWNNAVVSWGRADLYAGFETHMSHMLAQDKNNDYYGSSDGTFSTDDGQYAVYLSPRPDSDGGTDPDGSTDTINELLTTVQHEADCRIDVAEALFSGNRRSVADELARISKLGCTVRVIYGEAMNRNNLEAMHAAPDLKARGFYDLSNPDRLVTLHSKIMIIHAQVDGKHQDLVFTGSHNLTGPALRSNDEVLLKIKDPDVISDFDDNFSTLWDQARCENVPDETVCQHDE